MASSSNLIASAGSNRLDLDDTQPLTCSFLATETIDDHVVYIIRVQRGLDSKYSWQIKKRYNEFYDLHAQLKSTNIELPMPPKKMFGNMKKEFLSVRQNGLEVNLNIKLSNLC
jgi:PX domain-containing protein kinase-like protein